MEVIAIAITIIIVNVVAVVGGSSGDVNATGNGACVSGELGVKVGAVRAGAGACEFPCGADLLAAVLCLLVVAEGALLTFGAGPLDVVHAVGLSEPRDRREWYCYLLPGLCLCNWFDE